MICNFFNNFIEKVARILGIDDVLLKKVLDLCSDQLIMIKSESQRLLARIIKYANENEIIKRIEDVIGFAFLLEMLNSEHILMKNEALIALNILIIHCKDQIVHKLVDQQIGLKIQQFLVNLDSFENYTFEVWMNALVLIENLLKYKLMKSHFASFAIENQLSSIATKHSDLNCKINELINCMKY